MNHLYETLNLFATLGDKTAVWSAQGAGTWAEMAALTAEYEQDWKELDGASLGIGLTPRMASVAALAALDRLNCDVTLMEANVSDDLAMNLGTRIGWSHWLRWNSEAGWEVRYHGVRTLTGEPRPGVTILTSGTEGEPKAVRHTWESLFRPVRPTSDGRSQHWVSAFRLHLYAGLQVLTQSLGNGGCLILPDLDGPVDELVQQMQDAGGTHCSATPSFWRRLLIFASPPALTRIPFRQITLGGEPVDQLLLDQLHGLYPQARLVHIYATTELGRCFSVNDGLAGFPAEYLTAGRLSDVELQIRDNQLFVRSPNRATEVLNVTSATSNLADCHEGWTPTGDVVRLAGERVQFDGRLGEMINVGGNKVRPLLVESVIRSVNPVQDVLVYGQPSSIAGQIVACQVVIGTGMDEDWARQQIQLACEQQLQRHERPRLIQFVPRIDLTAAGKKRRNAAQ